MRRARARRKKKRKKAMRRRAMKKERRQVRFATRITWNRFANN